MFLIIIIIIMHFALQMAVAKCVMRVIIYTYAVNTVRIFFYLFNYLPYVGRYVYVKYYIILL